MVAWLGGAGRRFERRRCGTPKLCRRPIHGPRGGILSRKARRMAIYVSVLQAAHCAHATAAQNKWHANLLRTGNKLPPRQVGTVRRSSRENTGKPRWPKKRA